MEHDFTIATISYEYFLLSILIGTSWDLAEWFREVGGV